MKTFSAHEAGETAYKLELLQWPWVHIGYLYMQAKTHTHFYLFIELNKSVLKCTYNKCKQ